MTTTVILNALFAILIVSGVAAVCRAAYLVAGVHVELRQPETERTEEEELLAA